MASPQRLPKGWKQATTEEGDTYYYNKGTGERQWEMPKPAAATAADLRTPPRRSMGAPRSDAGSDLDDEEERLPPGWTAYKTEEGRAYYVNDVDGRTQWNRPVDADAAAMLVPPSMLAEVQERESEMQRKARDGSKRGVFGKIFKKRGGKNAEASSSPSGTAASDAGENDGTTHTADGEDLGSDSASGAGGRPSSAPRSAAGSAASDPGEPGPIPATVGSSMPHHVGPRPPMHVGYSESNLGHYQHLQQQQQQQHMPPHGSPPPPQHVHLHPGQPHPRGGGFPPPQQQHPYGPQPGMPARGPPRGAPPPGYYPPRQQPPPGAYYPAPAPHGGGGYYPPPHQHHPRAPQPGGPFPPAHGQPYGSPPPPRGYGPPQQPQHAAPPQLVQLHHHPPPQHHSPPRAPRPQRAPPHPQRQPYPQQQLAGAWAPPEEVERLERQSDLQQEEWRRSTYQGGGAPDGARPPPPAEPRGSEAAAGPPQLEHGCVMPKLSSVDRGLFSGVTRVLHALDWRARASAISRAGKGLQHLSQQRVFLPSMCDLDVVLQNQRAQVLVNKDGEGSGAATASGISGTVAQCRRSGNLRDSDEVRVRESARAERQFFSPEVLRGFVHERSHVYNYGVLCMRLLTGFPAWDPERVPASIVDRVMPIVDACPRDGAGHFSDVDATLLDPDAGWPMSVACPVLELIRRCCEPEAHRRPSIPELQAILGAIDTAVVGA